MSATHAPLTNVVTIPLAFSAGLIVAIALALYLRREDACHSVAVNGLACVECHAPGRTSVTCAPARPMVWP